MLTGRDVAALDQAVERMLLTGDRGEITMIGAGEMTCVLRWRGHACKRLPPFDDLARVDAYAQLLEEYIRQLRASGVPVIDTALHTVSRSGKHMVYLSGVTDHHVESAAMLDHIVALVEAKAAEIEAQMIDAGNAEAAE